jgi:hypothetical protein
VADPTYENYFYLYSWVTLNDFERHAAKTCAHQEFKEAYRFAKKGGMIGKLVVAI